MTAHDERGREHPFDANHLGKLERGNVRRPGPLIRAALCAVLDATEADLGFIPGAQDDRLAAGVCGRLRPDEAAVDAVASVLSSLRRLEDTTSAAEVVSAVRTQAAVAKRLAENASGATRDRAVGLVSELEQYQGWLAIPLRQWAQAREHLDRAAVLALEAKDPTRLANALSFAAYRNLLRQNVTSAVALNAAAARQDVALGLRTYMTFQRAELLAYNAERDGARRVLVEADRSLDRLADSTETADDSGYWYTPAVLLGHRGFVLNALGDRAGARDAATDALATMPPEWATAEWAAEQRSLAGRDS